MKNKKKTMFFRIRMLFINIRIDVERILRGSLTEVELPLNVKSVVNLMLTNKTGEKQ